MSLLAEIVQQKRAEALELQRRRSAAADGDRRPDAWPLRDVRVALRRPQDGALRVIAEVKLRSPSAGVLSTETCVASRAAAYAEAGAAMVSILTDARWFGGSFADLERARERLSVPLLCKDFLIDENQIRRAWSAGADAALLIARCIPDGRMLRDLVEATRGYGLEPFVEVFSEAELERALSAGALVIGVNARDLDTLKLDAERAARVLASIPKSVIAVHLSGLRTPQDAARIAASRADAALVGETLMRQPDPRPLLMAMVAAATPEPQATRLP